MGKWPIHLICVSGTSDVRICSHKNLPQSYNYLCSCIIKNENGMAVLWVAQRVESLTICYSLSNGILAYYISLILLSSSHTVMHIIDTVMLYCHTYHLGDIVFI
jgi:hypothetical protein